MDEIRCYICGNTHMRWVLDIERKPEVEVDYNIPESEYFRQIFECDDCKTYNNIHKLIEDATFYSGEYNRFIDNKALKSRFDRIISIEPKLSDNKQRVKRVVDFIGSYIKGNSLKNILDVGSGTCVFLYEIMKETKLKTYCIDPDPNAIEHAIKNVQVNAGYTGTIYNYKPDKLFDIISFNKVLEHIKDPLAVLKKSLELLSSNGFFYIELPESNRIVDANLIEKRAEFAVEHYTIHNENSIKYIADKLQLKIDKCQAIEDPSGKFTIFAFMSRKN